MKTMIIHEGGHLDILHVPETPTFDLSQMKLRHCTGCWTCWWKTPGHCVHKELDAFYQAYVHADKAVFMAKVSQGFVSSEMKTLFDRMIPLFLPYMDYSTGESMHAPRYEKYPDIEFYYDGDFDNNKSREIYIDYIKRVFYQFHSKSYVVRPVSELKIQAGETR